MSKLISVIVPVYNVVEYLERCLDSIVTQTYKDLEIILIDDGSTDGSSELCDHYAKTYNQVHVIHQENGGPSDARNAGLEIASGELISFVDADDFIHHNMYEIMCPLLDILSVDFVECELLTINSDIKIPDIVGYTVETCGIEEMLIGSIQWKKHYSVLWNKVYRHDKIKDIRFLKGRYNEDEFFNNQYWPHVDRVGYVSVPLYFYRQRANSLSKQPITFNRLDAIHSVVEKYYMVKKFYPKLIDYLLCHVLDMYFCYLDWVMNDGNDTADILRHKMADIIFPIYNELMKCELISNDAKKRLASDMINRYGAKLAPDQ